MLLKSLNARQARRLGVALALTCGVSLAVSQEIVYPASVVGLPRQELVSLTVGMRTTVVVPTDVNGDGIIDLVAGVSGDDDGGDPLAADVFAQVALGQGDGTYVLGPMVDPIQVKSFATSAAFADLDGDGVDEVVFGLRDTVGAFFETLVVVSFDASGVPTVVDRPALTGPTEPTKILLEDVTSDGIIDIVVLRRLQAFVGTSSVFVLAGFGDGTFDAPVEAVSTNTARDAIGLGDFDADGFLDLVVIDAGAGQVEVHGGGGDGTFAAPSLQAVAGASDVEVYDANGDGNVDIAVSSTTNAELTLLLGDGGGRFPTVAVSDAVTAVDLDRGDLTGDGVDELFLFNREVADQSVSVFESADLSGTFLPITPLTTSPWGRKQVFVTHLDGDTSPDLVAAGWAPLLFAQAVGGVDIGLGGDGTVARLNGFLDAALPLGAPLLDNLLLSDFNGDGLGDLAQHVFDFEGRVNFFASSGSTFTPVGSFVIDAGMSVVGLSAHADVTGDTIADLIMVSRGTSTIRVYPGLGGFDFGSPVDSLAAGGGLSKLLLADFDDDGLPDAQVRAIDGRVLTFRNLGAGQFALFDIEVGPYIDIALGDASGDGAIDSLRLRQDTVTTERELCVRGGLSGFGFDVEFCTPVDDAIAEHLVAADINGSGTVDAILIGATGEAESLIQPFIGAWPFFTPLETTLVPVRADWLEAADENGDGLVDLIVSTDETVPGGNDDVGRLAVIRSMGGAAFEVQEQSYVRAIDLTAGDINGDGVVDVAIQEIDGVSLLIHDPPHPWATVAGGLATATGVPQLRAQGIPAEGSSIALELSDALPGLGPFLVIGFDDLSSPLKGGVLVPSPDLLIQLPPADTSGTLELSATWTAFPAGLELYIQAWQLSASGSAASTGLSVTSR